MAGSFENSPRRAHLAQAGAISIAPGEFYDALVQYAFSLRAYSLDRTCRLLAIGSTPHEQSSSLDLALSPSLPILVKTFSSYTEQNQEFFIKASGYFRHIHATAGEVIWKQKDVADGLYLIETGCLRASYSVSTSQSGSSRSFH